MIAKHFAISLIISSTTGNPQSAIDLTIAIESSVSSVCKPISRDFATTLLLKFTIFGTAL
ncbi:hypothetical protein HanRHA438_Chr12g0552151 [Helianthus annuus]|nr:hypothetical protein HanRHA438_Chr12g0552151 [Helianthus annuus]